MKTTLPGWLGAAALALAGTACAAETTSSALPQPHTLTTRFTYTATVPSAPDDAKSVRLWLPLPSDSEWQTVSDVTVESPAPHRITTEKAFDNRMVYVQADRSQLPLSVTVGFTVLRHPVQVLKRTTQRHVEPVREIDRARRLLGADRKVPIGGRYGNIAREVAGESDSPTEKARALFDHVVATMQYDYNKESPKLGEGDVAFVCDYKKGNCSDLHSYLISLSRSLKIPAVLEYGFPIAGIPVASNIPKDGSIGGYHCWTWVHDPENGWFPLDASDARRWSDAKHPDGKDYMFGNLITERAAVAMSRGRDLTLEPKQKAGPLNYFIYPYAEADGKPVEAKWELNYRLEKVETP